MKYDIEQSRGRDEDKKIVTVLQKKPDLKERLNRPI